ncbi:unnamed protein product [Protopolystoma xenopodis]|uniref:Uncharacterized protein n=1 Tax=Protopolystoma xenopodis TaxID=117903 RepID=A0A3S5CGB7_9PLAT|nr:unnamed protein product [Protopolystoma xenopodis]
MPLVSGTGIKSPRPETAGLSSTASRTGQQTNCLGSQIHVLAGLFDCPFVILLHPLNSGLVRVGCLRARASGSCFDAGPLVSGQVVSRRCLASLVRQTVGNTARRRRLASDAFHPPHVHRAHRIAEILRLTRRYQQQNSPPIAASHEAGQTAMSDSASVPLSRIKRMPMGRTGLSEMEPFLPDLAVDLMCRPVLCTPPVG